MQARPRRPGLLRLWLTFGALAALVILALPAAGQADPSPPSASATPPTAMVGVMGSALRQTAQLAPAAVPPPVCASVTPLQGIDVSYYQGSGQHPPTSINWTQVAQAGKS